MRNKITLRLIIEEQEAFLIEGIKKGRKINWNHLAENPRHFPPMIMASETIGKTYDSITDYIDNLMEKKLSQNRIIELL